MKPGWLLSLVLPTTQFGALLLLAVALIGLGSWPNLFKIAGSRWRFELFYFDFALGVLVFAVIAAFTLGTLGSEIAFTDRMQVAGRTSQMLAIVGGFLFNIGNMLLLAAMSVIGMAAVFPLAIGVVLIVSALLSFPTGHALSLTIGIVLVLVTLAFDIVSCRSRANDSKRANMGKGLLLAALAGAFYCPLSYFYRKSMAGDLSVGPYGGLLMMAIGAAISTAFFSIYFINIAIEGQPVKLNAFLKGTPKEHLSGFTAGVIFAGGALAEFLAVSQLSPAQANTGAGRAVPFAAGSLAMLWAFAVWHEFGRASKNARNMAWASAVLLAVAAVVIGYAR